MAIGIFLAFLFEARLSAFPFFISWPVSLFTGLWTALLLVYVFGKLILRFQSGKSLILEGLLSLLILAGILIDSYFAEGGLPLLFWGFLAALMVVLLLMKQRFYFYLSFSGLTLFGLILVSFWCIELQRYVIVSAYEAAWSGVQQQNQYSVQQREQDFSVSRGKDVVLQFKVPEGLYAHLGDELKKMDSAGRPIVLFSADDSDTQRIPVIVLFEISSGMDRDTIRNRATMLLENVQSNQVEDLKKEKETSLLSPDFPFDYEGSFWTYFDRFEATRIRTGFFLFRPAGQELPPLMVWIREPVAEGFPFHPATLALLKSFMPCTGQCSSN
ncbi:MAG: hypothetical protein KDK37_13655 [Leptospiraceae bacterium]|nr:hypothetical protein [Leptospiraceae bacterium]